MFMWNDASEVPNIVHDAADEFVHWELYLTKDAIHHTKNANISRGCCLTYWNIQLSEIKRILVKENKTTIWVNVGNENIHKYISRLAY